MLLGADTLYWLCLKYIATLHCQTGEADKYNNVLAIMSLTGQHDCSSLQQLLR